MSVSDNGVSLIKHFEGCELKAYKCPAGIWTIGYGHTGDVTDGQIITADEADEILRRDLEVFERQIVAETGEDVSLEQHQLDALVSLVFNIGIGNFRKSTVLRKLKEADFDAAADAFLSWNKATVDGRKVELAGLTRRRRAERSLFLGDTENFLD